MDLHHWVSPRLRILIIVFLGTLLSACFDWHNDSSASTGTDTLTGVDTSNNGTELPAENPEDQYTAPAEDTASAEPDPVIIALSWQPIQGNIDGYIVHTGPTPETASAVITVTPNPSVEYDTMSDLGLKPGDQSCFRIKAYNIEGESGFSDAVCYLVNA